MSTNIKQTKSFAAMLERFQNNVSIFIVRGIDKDKPEGSIKVITSRMKNVRVPDAREIVINRMTNWQRNQAGKACKGRWDRLSYEKLTEFANKPHWKRA